MNFTIYNLATGEILQSGQCQDEDYDLQHIPENCAIINLASNCDNQYVDNLLVVDKPAKPTEFHVFDYEIKQWVPNFDIAAQNAKRQRNLFLYQSDWTQLPHNPLTPEKQQQWAEYRQALRDITMQAQYPFQINWPLQPE